jgi:hypothetical protein
VYVNPQGLRKLRFFNGRRPLAVYIDDSLGKGLRSFLRHIVTGALEGSVRVFAREFLGIACFADAILSPNRAFNLSQILKRLETG